MTVMNKALFRAAVIATVLNLAPAVAGEDARSSQSQTTPLFATVNGQAISVAEFEATANEAYRRKFYHGKPPEVELNGMLREVGQGMIDKILLEAQVVQRQVEPDRAAVDAEIAGYEQRYQGSPQWLAQRAEALPRIRSFLETKSRLSQLEAKVRDVPPPSGQALRSFYDKNPDLFTEPEKTHIAAITFGVDPSSSAAVWDAAKAAAEATRKEVLAGADFGELAKARSTDHSRANGGDMGYIHRGMLSNEVHGAVDGLKAGEISTPVRALEGYVLVKLVERIPARLREFKDVETRARDLWRREAADKAWSDYLAKLRASAAIKVEAPFKAFMEPSAAN